MEEVKLWRIVNQPAGKPVVQPIETVGATDTEQLLEDVLAQSPDVLMSGLTLVGRQNVTAGGPLDLLGVDEDGRLVVFELKRGMLTRDAVAQVVDYASYLDALEVDELNRHVSDMSGRGGTERIEDFGRWYQENYSAPLAEIGRPRMVLVGLGVDEPAKRMVEFLAGANLDISLITFYGFRQDGQTMLARQLEVQARGAEQTNKTSKRQNQQDLEERLQEYRIEPQYTALATTLRDSLGESVYYQWPNPSGYTFYLPEITDAGKASNRAYGGIYVPDNFASEKKLRVSIHERVVETVNKDRLDLIAKALQSSLTLKPSGSVEILLDATQSVAGYQNGMVAIGALWLEAWQARRRPREADLASSKSPQGGEVA